MHFVFKVFCGYRLMIPATLKKKGMKSLSLDLPVVGTTVFVHVLRCTMTANLSPYWFCIMTFHLICIAGMYNVV